MVSESACVQIAMSGTGIAVAAKQIMTQKAATEKVYARRPSDGLLCLQMNRRAIMNPSDDLDGRHFKNEELDEYRRLIQIALGFV